MVDVGEINALVFNNIPILTGEISANLRSEVNVFVKCCERIEACLTGNAEKNIFMQLLGTRIRTRAAEAIEGTYCVTVADLKKALNEKLLQNRPYQVLRGELQTLYQFPGESVESFGNRVKNLLRESKEAIESTDETIRKTLKNDLEEQALHVFKAGLNNTNLRWFCLSDSEKTLNALLQKAIKLELADKIGYSNRYQTQNQSMSYPHANQSSTPNTQNNGYSSYNSANTPSHITSHEQKIVNTRQNNFLNQNKFNSVKPSAKCNFCGKIGHYFLECRIRKGTPFCSNCKLYGHLAQYCKEKSKTSYNNNQRQVQCINRNSSNRKEIKTCDFCKRRNHTVSDCKAKQEWDSKNGAQPSGN